MKKFIKSAWGISIGTALLSFALTVIYDLLKGKPILSTVWNIIKAIWSFIITVLNLELKLWWILLGIVAIFFVIWIIAEFYSAINEGPPLMKYTNDTIQGWKWEWYWQKTYDGKYDIKNLHPVCDECGTSLASKHDYHNTLYCVRCGKTYDGMKLPDETHIKIYISDTVNHGLIPKDNT